MNTVERLSSFYTFSEDVLADVARAAEVQDNLTCHELADTYRLDEIFKIDTPEGAKKPLEVIDYIPPASDRPETANVGFAAFGASLNASAVWRILRLVEAAPDQRWVFFGNSSSIVKNVGRLTVAQALKVAVTRDLEPTVAPALQYLDSEGVTHPSFFGFSFAVDKAQAAGIHAGKYGMAVDRTVMVEPANVVKRTVPHLGFDFLATKKEHANYVDQTGCNAYANLLNIEDSVAFMRYVMGLGRLSNLAVLPKLKNDEFGRDLDTLLEKQPGVIVTVGYGTESELTVPEAISGTIHNAMNKYGQGRVREMVLNGMHHAGMENLNLYAAMMLQGLRANSGTALAHQQRQPAVKSQVA